MYDLLSAYFTNSVTRMLCNGICVFKRFMFRSPEVSNSFVSGQRVSSVYHCRKNNFSNLNKDLLNNHLNQRLHVNVALRVRMLNTTFSSVINSQNYGLVCSRPSVNFSLSVYAFSCTIHLIFLMTTMLNCFCTFNIL